MGDKKKEEELAEGTIIKEKDFSNVTKGSNEKLNENWRRVSMEKASKSPRQSPKELNGMVTIVTPSIFAALSNLEEINDVELEPIEVNKEIRESKKEEMAVSGANQMEVEKPKVVSECGRQILPRNSKTFHKILSETSKGELGATTRGSQNHH